MLNTDYKIVMKAMSNRIYDSLADIVSDTQAANIVGRSAQLSILAMSDIFHWINTSNNAGIIIAIDSEKAFDRVDHVYMEQCLLRSGIDRNLVEKLRLIYSRSVARVMVNGVSTEAFPVERGIRQGCPLSAALFIITLEPFLQKIKKLTPPLFLPGFGMSVPVFAFADDVTVIVQRAEDILAVLQACKEYEQISGAKINRDKSALLCFGSRRVSSNMLYGIPVREEIKILGIDFNAQGPSKRTWYKKLNETREEIEKLGKVKSTIFARIIIAKTHLFSKVQYVAQTQVIDSKLCKKLDKLIFPFIWGSGVEAVSRAWMKQPRDKGGYNIPDLALIARANHLVWTMRALVSDMKLVTTMTRYSLGIGARLLEGHLDNNKPRTSNIRPYYQAVINDCKIIQAKQKDVNLQDMTTSEIVSLLRTESSYAVRKPIPGKVPNWGNISSNFLESSRKSLMWRLAHGILPLLNYHRKKRHRRNVCEICGGDESLQHFFFSMSFP